MIVIVHGQRDQSRRIMIASHQGKSKQLRRLCTCLHKKHICSHAAGQSVQKRNIGPSICQLKATDPLVKVLVAHCLYNVLETAAAPQRAEFVFGRPFTGHLPGCLAALGLIHLLPSGPQILVNGTLNKGLHTAIPGRFPVFDYVVVLRSRFGNNLIGTKQTTSPCSLGVVCNFRGELVQVIHVKKRFPHGFHSSRRIVKRVFCCCAVFAHMKDLLKSTPVQSQVVCLRLKPVINKNFKDSTI